MKLWTVGTIGAGLVASLTSGTLVEFNQNLLALNTQSKSSGISFNLVEPRALSATLQRREGMYGGSERIPCSFTDTNTTTGNSTIVIAISKCLNQSAIDIIHDWIEKVKADNLYYTDNGENKQLTFSTTLIPGECEVLSESEDAGRERDEPDIDKDDMTKPLDDVLSDGTDYQSSKQLVPEEVARIQAFAQHGRVLGSLDDLGSDPAAAVLSFVNNEHSYDYIMTYEETHKISSMFNFKMCQEGESCEGHFENCIELQESIDLFMYNPFQITRSTQCGKLQGGIPVTYVDDKGKRQCFCTCPAGTKLKDDDTVDGVDECVEMETETCPCTWSTHPFGFKYENTENLEQCSFSNIATDWNLPVPFPSDNYVSDYRTNHQDDRTDDELESGPRIDVMITPINSHLYDNEVLASRYALAYPSQPMSDLPPDLEDMLSIIGQGEIGTLSSPTEPYGPPQCTHHTWKDYQLHSQEKIDAITITAYGKYEVSVDAYDYANNKRCIGCAAVVDKFRPKATTTCPTSFCDNTTSLCATGELAVAELTSDNVDKASSLVASFYDFGDKAVNDACSTERCDDETFAVHDIFTPESSVQSKPFTSGKTCFSSIEDDFKSSAKATTNPLKEESGMACQTPLPVEKYQCMRCCEYSTQLREHWVDYSCGYDYDQRYCEGDPDQTCSFKQCLVLTGDTVVHASASIKQSIRNESIEVLKGLRGQGFQTHTQIHRALQCADFGANDSSCTYTASIDQLIEIDVTNKFGGNNNQYAFWRYKIDGDAAGWRLWEDMTPYTFMDAQTKITLEAWTACGRARKFFFYMHLHPHTDIKVCDVFKQMWYQTTKSRIEVPTHLCAYPGSDFAELTFDYQANIGLKHSRNNLKLHIAKLRCELAFQDRVSTEILSVQGESFDVLQRYAIELQTQTTTSDFTEFTVTCTFSYEGPSGVTDEKTCPMTLTITDCNGPTIDIPRDDCSWDDCAGQDAPGPFEACGGHIVRATATATYMDTDDKACCETCHPLVCTPVLNLPDPSQDIKRCIPEGYEDEYEAAMYDNYNYDTGYYDQFGVLMATAVANHPSEVAATVLLAVCALVAILALVVVQRRRAQAAKETVMMEDVYYPLLH